MEPLRFDIGGVYVLELVQGGSGYYGHYTVVRTGKVFSYDGSGMSKKQILTKFWNRAKEYSVA